MTCQDCEIRCGKWGKDRNGVQRYRCKNCEKTYLEPREKPLGAMRLPLDRAIICLKLLVEGNSIRSAERITVTHRDTIMRLLNVVGEKCMRLMQEKMKGLDCRHIQVDEIWSFVGKKQKRVTRKDSSEVGDQYTFVAIDAETKLVPAFRVGKRDGLTTRRFLEGLSETVTGKFQLTSDAYRPYIESVERVFGADVDYAQMIKVYGGSIEPGRERYSPAKCVGTQTSIIQGRPERELVSTSYVERQNLTMRMNIRRFRRLTNGFSKSLKNLKAAVALHFAHYNFCRVHSTLKCTPAMEAGIAGSVWSFQELLKAA